MQALYFGLELVNPSSKVVVLVVERFFRNLKDFSERNEFLKKRFVIFWQALILRSKRIVALDSLFSKA